MGLLRTAPSPYVLVTRNHVPFPQSLERREIFQVRGKTVRRNPWNKNNMSYPRGRAWRRLFPEQPSFRTLDLYALEVWLRWARLESEVWARATIRTYHYVR